MRSVNCGNLDSVTSQTRRSRRDDESKCYGNALGCCDPEEQLVPWVGVGVVVGNPLVLHSTDELLAVM